MPSTELRQQVLTRVRRLVVKVGSQLLTNPEGQLDGRYMKAIGDQIAELVKRGYEITLVSSGAIAVGRKTLGLERKPKDIAKLQGVAAIGQIGLMQRWHDIFAKHGLHAAQILLTRGDFEDRKRFLNLRNCIVEVQKMGAVPIINENDTVAVDEIRLGDNDVLASMVANALTAEMLVLLTSVEGLKDADGNIVEMVDDVGAVMSLVQKGTSALGTGGMGTKLQAARAVTDSGEVAVVAGGRVKDVLLKLTAGEKIGTVFVPASRRMPLRDRWIGHAVRPAGVIIVDDGAARALASGGKSLLATGITEVTGNFEKGDVVVVRDGRGREIARGLINYNADEARAVMGRKTAEFEKLLGRKAYDEVIHRDNLVVKADAAAV